MKRILFTTIIFLLIISACDKAYYEPFVSKTSGQDTLLISFPASSIQESLYCKREELRKKIDIAWGKLLLTHRSDSLKIVVINPTRDALESN